MDFLIFPIGLLYFFVFSFTGGFAGAIHAGGREDRSLVANAGIGLSPGQQLRSSGGCQPVNGPRSSPLGLPG